MPLLFIFFAALKKENIYKRLKQGKLHLLVINVRRTQIINNIHSKKKLFVFFYLYGNIHSIIYNHKQKKKKKYLL